MSSLLDYHIPSNRRPGVYFFRDSADPAFKRGRRLNGVGVYLVHVFLAHAHPGYVAHAEVEIHFTTVWQANGATYFCLGIMFNIISSILLYSCISCYVLSAEHYAPDYARLPCVSYIDRIAARRKSVDPRLVYTECS